MTFTSQSLMWQDLLYSHGEMRKDFFGAGQKLSELFLKVVKLLWSVRPEGPQHLTK